MSPRSTIGIMATAGICVLSLLTGCEGRDVLDPSPPDLAKGGGVAVAGVAQDLGTLGGGSAAGAAINDAGEVAGTSTNSSGRSVAFLWVPALGMREVAAMLPGHNTAGVSSLTASRVMAGGSGISVVAGSSRAARWIPTGTDTWTVEELVVPGALESDAVEIDGTTLEAAGSFFYPGTADRAVFWRADGSAVDLAAHPYLAAYAEYSWARDLNANGHIVGVAHTPRQGDGRYRSFAFVWSKSTNTVQELPRLATCAGAAAVAINARDEIVGVCGEAGGAGHILLWRPATTGGWSAPEDLGGLGYGVDPWDLNDRGDVVGAIYTSRSSRRPFIYTRERGIQLLTSIKGGSDGIAHAVNNAVNPQVTGWQWSGPYKKAIRWTVQR